MVVSRTEQRASSFRRLVLYLIVGNILLVVGYCTHAKELDGFSATVVPFLLVFYNLLLRKQIVKRIVMRDSAYIIYPAIFTSILLAVGILYTLFINV